MIRLITRVATCCAVIAMQRPLQAQASHRQGSSLAVTLDQYVAPLIDLGVFSGTILVSRGGRTVIERSYGLADAENAIPVGPSTVFRIASISKSFTSALIGRLADQKQLSLNDPLSRWLPTMPSADRITLRQLLVHRAGIPNVNSLLYDEETLAPNSLAELVDSISHLPLDFEPDTRSSYSNGGYALLARVVVLVTHETFERVLHGVILQPLHLNQTRHESDGMIIAHLARGYMPCTDRAYCTVHAPYQEMSTKTGGGSMVSSPRDLITWVRAIGRSKILKPETWAELFPSPDSTLAFQGRAPGFNVIVTHDRRRDLTTVVLANNYAAGMVADVAAGVDAIALGNTPRVLPATGPATVSEAEQNTLLGKYSVPDGVLPIPPASTLDIRMIGDHLVAYLGGTPVDVLIPQGHRSFLARSLWSIFVVEGKSSAVDSITVRALYRNFSFTAKRIVQ